MSIKIALSVFVATILLIGLYALYIPHANLNNETAPLAEITPVPAPPVFLKDAYRKGEHTISGSLLAPTACTTLTATANVSPSAASSTPETITITLLMPPDTGVCLQQLTKMSFTVSATAAADALFHVLVNGQVASTTIE